MDLFDTQQIQQIVPSLFISSSIAAENALELQQLGISSILICADIEPPHPTLFNYKVMKLDDSPTQNLLQHLQESFNFIEQAMNNKRGVLVHCHAGVSRSAAIIIAYLMKLQKASYFHCFKQVKDIRKSVNPNSGFVEQLEFFERINYLTESEKLHEMGEYQCLLQELENKQNKTDKTMIDFFPKDDKTNLDDMESVIRSFGVDRVSWGFSRKLYLAFGVYKLRISLTLPNENFESFYVDDFINEITSTHGAYIDYAQIVDTEEYSA